MSLGDLEAPAPGRSFHPDGRWRIELFGGLSASSGGWKVPHFPGRPVAALLARLAMQPQRRHAREELIELLWPGVELHVGRNRLRQVLSTLRGLLDGPGSGGHQIVIADRTTVCLDASRVVCDVSEFERACRARRDEAARGLYRGELLPGFYDSWIIAERSRLEAMHDQLVERAAAVGTQDADRTATSAPDAQAAGRPLRSRITGLPSYLSSFVGRRREWRQCLESIGRHRLVTLTGMGGCGKTRLATEVAQACVAFDIAFFVDLSECRDAAEIGAHLRVAARLPMRTGAALDQVVQHVKERRALFVLDNFEQLVGSGGAEVLGELLASLPLAHALVTSRRVLRLPGEQEQALAPLPVPDLGDDLAEAARNPSVALFLGRARAVRGDFRLDATNREDVLVLCRALEGLPLALEIAASRVRTYSLREMRAELARGLAQLVRRAPHGSDASRHASLQTAIDWSWRLLSPRVQGFLGDLTVFRGGFAPADARGVIGAEDTHDLLDILVADSILVAGPDIDGDPAKGRRFQVLESVREFVAGRIDAPRAADVRRAHRAYFLSEAMALAERHQQVPTTALGNFIGALRSALDDAEHELALALLLALKEQWESVGTPPEALTLMRRRGTDRACRNSATRQLPEHACTAPVARGASAGSTRLCDEGAAGGGRRPGIEGRSDVRPHACRMGVEARRREGDRCGQGGSATGARGRRPAKRKHRR